MTLIKLTHATKDTPVYVVLSHIAFYYNSPAAGFTYVVMSAGATFPAKETVDEVRRLLTETTVQGGQTNGT